MKRLLKIAALLSLLFLTGCWDGSELSNRGFVTAMSIDIDDDADDIYKVSLEMPKIEKNNDNQEKNIKSGTHRSLNNAIYSTDASSEHEIFLGHMKVLIGGEELLKDREMFKHALETLSRDRSISRTLLILAAEGDGSDIIEAESKEEGLIGLYISNFFKKKNPATAHRQTLDSLARYFAEGKTAIIPRVQASDEGFTFSGAAVMSDYELRGWLDEHELKALTWLNNEARHIGLDISGDEYDFSVEISKFKSRFTFFEQDGKLYAEINIKLEGDLQESPHATNISRDALTKKAEESIRNDLTKVYYALYVQMDVDGFNLNRELEKNNPKLHKRHIEYAGLCVMDIPVVFNIEVVIHGTGSLEG